MHLYLQFLNIMGYQILSKWYLLIIPLLCTLSASLYSPYYRKCLLNTLPGTDIGHVEIQRLPIIKDHYNYHPKIYYRKPIRYLEDVQFIYHKFLGAGASGQAYLIEHITKDPQNSKRTISTPKVIKRFFSERIRQFEEENFIMHELGYPIQWTMDMNPQRDTKQQSYSFTNLDHATIAMYPYYTSAIMRQADINSFDVRITIYKLCKQVQKAHQHGIIHSDLKLGNILIKIPDPNMDKLFDVQLIDWNLASFYYPGYFSNQKKGTPCYYSPQMLLRAGYITPQADIFSLGILTYYYLTNKKPFSFKCSSQKNNNLQAIASLVGLQNILDMVGKYRYNLNTQVKKAIKKMTDDPLKYQGNQLVDLIPQESAKYFNEYLIDLLQKMLIPDPELRITAAEILEHEYFNKVSSLPPMYYEKAKSKKKKGSLLQNSGEMDLETLKQKVKIYKEEKKKILDNEKESSMSAVETDTSRANKKEKNIQN